MMFGQKVEWAERFTGEETPLIEPKELPKWIVHEDEHVIAINKPGWLVCHPSKKGPMSSLAGAIRVYCQTEKLHLVSRLDRETSGIVLIAKHRKSASQYQKAVEARRVSKSYLVWLVGELKEDILVDQALGLDAHSPVHVKQIVREGKKTQTAQTRFERIDYSVKFNVTLARAIPVTGRKHQIRAHAEWLGLPVLGDKIYGPDARLYLEFIEKGWSDELERQLKYHRQALHARSLKFEGIDYQEDFEAPLTDDLRALNSFLGFPIEIEG